MLQPFKHKVVCAFLAKKRRHQTFLYSSFSGKTGKIESLRRYFNIVQMRKMAHSICLIKLYQITMRKKNRLFISGHLKETERFLRALSVAKYHLFTFISILASGGQYQWDLHFLALQGPHFHSFTFNLQSFHSKLRKSHSGAEMNRF